MYHSGALQEEVVFYDDPDPQLYISLKYPNRSHPHQVYKVEKTCLRKLSRYFAKSFDLFIQNGGVGIQSIEISQAICHEAFDACMRYMCYARFLPHEKARLEFNSDLFPELLEAAHFLEIEELKPYFLSKVVNPETQIDQSNVWRFVSVAFYLPTDRGFDRDEKIKVKVLGFLQNGNFLALRNIQGYENVLNKLPLEDFVSLLALNNSEKSKSPDPEKYLNNEDIIVLVEKFSRQKYEDNKELFKKTIKEILLETLQRENLTEEENLVFSNFELFFVISEYKRFQEHYKSQLKTLSEKLVSIEHFKRENQDLELKKSEEILKEKKGIKSELLVRLSNLEKHKSDEKATLQSRIQTLEKQNSELRAEISNVLETIKSSTTKDLSSINSEIETIISDLDECRRIETFRLVEGSNLLTVKGKKRILNWLKGMQAKAGILDTMGKMIVGSNTVNMEFELVYQASRDGATAKAFHEKCDTLRHTLVVMQSEHGKIFGGYTSSAAWQSMGMYAASDNQAFIFSLDHKICMPISDPNKAIYNHSNYGPTFGGGNEIFVSQAFSVDLGSHVNINGTSYTRPELHDNLKIDTFMAGSFHFKISEIEVFLLKSN